MLQDHGTDLRVPHLDFKTDAFLFVESFEFADDGIRVQENEWLEKETLWFLLIVVLFSINTNESALVSDFGNVTQQRTGDENWIVQI